MKKVILVFLLLNSLNLFSQVIDTSIWCPDYYLYDFKFDGKYIYLMGDFNYVGPLTGCFVKISKNSNVIDKNFPKIEGKVNCIVPDNKGGWYIGGAFSKVGNVNRYNIVHIFSNGVVDPDWDPHANREVNLIVKDTNCFYVGGKFDSIGGQYRTLLAKLNPDGSIDKNFNANLFKDKYNRNAIYSISINQNYLFICGDFHIINGDSVTGVAKINKITGEVDKNWNVKIKKSSGTGYFYAYSLISLNDKVYIGGIFDSVNGISRNGIFKTNITNGDIDLNWNPQFIYNKFSPDDKPEVTHLIIKNNFLYVGGRFNEVDGLVRSSLLRFTLSDGKIDNKWQIDTTLQIESLFFDNNDIYGIFALEKNKYNSYLNKIIKLNDIDGSAEGSSDFNLSYHYSYITQNSFVINGNDIFLGFGTQSFGGRNRIQLARLNKFDGKLDTLWNPNFDYEHKVGIISIIGNDIYANKYLYKNYTISDLNSVKLDYLTGEVDPNWDMMLKFNDSTGQIFAVNQDVDYLYFGGHFTKIRGQYKNSFARLNLKNGIIDPNWTPDLSNNDTTFSVGKFLIDSNDIYVESNFYTYVGNYKINNVKLIKINKSTGELDKNWDTKILPKNNYSGISKIENYKNFLYIYGDFQSIGGISNQPFIRLDKSTGKADTSFNMKKFIAGGFRAFSINRNYLYFAEEYPLNSSETYIKRVNLDNMKLDNYWKVFIDSSVFEIDTYDDFLLAGGIFNFVDKFKTQNIAKVNIYQAPVNLSLPADSVFYGKKRVHLERYDTCKCYTYKRFEDRLYFVNKTYSPLVLDSMKIKEDIIGDAFEIFDGKDYVPLKNYIGKLDELYDSDGNSINNISTMTTTYIPVYFHPKTSGEHKLSLEFEGNFENKPVFVLSGTGVYPKVIYADTVDFGTVKLGESNISIANVRFTNKDWEYSDTLKLWEFMTIPAKEISNVKGNFKPKGFYYGDYDKRINGKYPVNFPAYLAPNDYVEIKIQFAGINPGESIVNFSSRCDAETEVLTVLKGFVSDDGSVDFSTNEFDFKVYDNEIHFTLPSEQYLEITLYNLLGINISKLESSYFQSGENSIPLPNNELSQGTYFIEVKGNNFSKYFKFNILK